MVQVFLIAFGLICLIQFPALIVIGIGVGIIACIYNPDLFRSTGRSGASSSKTDGSVNSAYKGFTTYKEQQEKALKGIINPDYDPWSPENRERTQRLHNLIDRNRKIAEKEMRDEIEREEREKAARPS
jgi:hypothetical protein